MPSPQHSRPLGGNAVGVVESLFACPVPKHAGQIARASWLAVARRSRSRVGGLPIGSLIMVPLPTRLAELDSPVMLYDNDEIAHVGLAQDHRWRFRVDLDGIDPKYVSALLTIEDSRFYEHGGVDILAILRATFQNIAARRVVSGASTITMQLVRL